MTKNPSEEVFEEPFPSVEALGPFIGKWIGYDESGEVRVSGENVREAGENAKRAGLVDLVFFWVPNGALIG